MHPDLRTRASFLLLASIGVACGGTVPPESSPATPAVAPPSRSVSTRWEQKVERWTESVAVAESGEVVTVDSRTLRVHDPRDGHVIRSAPVCTPIDADALRFVGPRQLVVACADEWVTFSWPDLAKARTLRVAMGHAAIGPELVAAATQIRRIRIWSTHTFALADWFDVAGEVSGLAISPNGRALAVGTDEGLVLRDVVAQTNRALYPAGQGFGRGVRTMSFSPDGRRLFAGTESGGVEIEVATGGILRSVPIETWVTAVRYLSDDAVVVTGARGLFLVDKSNIDRSPHQIDRRLDGGLDVAPDGSAFCAGSREGNVGCFTARGFGRHALASTGAPAWPKTAPPPEPEGPLVDGPRAAKPPGGAPQGTALVWSLYDSGTRTLVLTPAGELLSASGAMLNVHAAGDGRVTGNYALCKSRIQHLAFVDPGRLFFLCEHEAGIATFPAVKVTATYPVESLGSEIRSAGGRVAFETAMGNSIVVRTADGWSPVDDFPIAARLESFALSPDGKKLAYALYNSGIVVRDLATRKETLLSKDAKGDGLVFSPDGARLFTLGPAAFQAIELDVATGTQKRAWNANTWITEAHYLTDDTIVAVGAGGLTIFGNSGGQPPPSLDPYRSAIAVGADASTFCASGTKGELACFRRAPPGK